MFTLNTYNLIRSIAYAVVAGAYLSVVGLFSQGFDVFTADWVSIGKQFVNGGFLALITSLTVNFFTGVNGNLFTNK